MFTIHICLTSVTQTTEDQTQKELFSGMGQLIHMWILDSSTYSDKELNGPNADGILRMKAFLNIGEFQMSQKFKFVTLLRHKSMVKELS